MSKQKQKKQFLYTTCCELVFHREFNEQSLVILWVKWCKNEGFWKRFTCTKHEESNISKNPVDNKNQDSKNFTEETKPDIVSHFFPADHINKHVIPYSLIPTLTKEEKKILEHNIMCMRVKEYYGIDISWIENRCFTYLYMHCFILLKATNYCFFIVHMYPYHFFKNILTYV